MWIDGPPESYHEIDRAALDEYLTRCDDYYRIGFCQEDSYRFVHNDRQFAVVWLKTGQVYADPQLLEAIA